MKKFEVSFMNMQQMSVLIEANSLDEAIQAAKDNAYDSSDVILQGDPEQDYFEGAEKS